MLNTGSNFGNIVLGAVLGGGLVYAYLSKHFQKLRNTNKPRTRTAELEAEFRLPTYKLFAIVKHFCSELNKVT